MKMYVAAALLVLGMHTPAMAQYTGPGSQPAQSSIKQILENPVDDMAVVLRGKILRQLSSDKYMFTDGTGEIRVEIDTKLFPATAINETVQVELSGEVEKDFMESPEIDAKALRVIN